MSFNLALILTLLTVFTGIVYALDKFVWRVTENGGNVSNGLRILVEQSRSFFPVLLLVLMIRSFVFEPFRIPSGSMMPNLLTGDFIFVQKYSYGLRLPVTETKIFETGSPQRGDVMVFRLPQDPSVNYIKRVIGVPGDRVVYRDHRLTINGERIPLRESDEFEARRNPEFVEDLFGREHDILVQAPYNREGEGVYIVPEDAYFVMGDNRDNSKDSRVIGAIPESHLVGKAVRIWMHMDGLSWPRWDRIGQKIQ